MSNFKYVVFLMRVWISVEREIKPELTDNEMNLFDVLCPQCSCIILSKNTAKYVSEKVIFEEIKNFFAVFKVFDMKYFSL